MTPREALVVLNLLEGIGDDLASTIRMSETTTDLAGELKRVEEFGARLVFQEDDEYPELLREIYDLPSCFTRRAACCPRVTTASRLWARTGQPTTGRTPPANSRTNLLAQASRWSAAAHAV